MFYPTALAITLISEVSGMFLYGAWRRQAWEDHRRAVFVALSVNLITHPIFWLTFPAIPLTFIPKLYLAELIVAVVEGIVYRRCCRLGWSEALWVGLALNLLSAATGLAFWQIWFGE
jgi:hypothetical protein